MYEKHIMIFEWAEYGNLREIYKDNYIRWEDKISIAKDICHELSFLE